VLDLVGQNVGGHRAAGQDVAAESLGLDRHQVHPEPALDSRIFDHDRRYVAGLDDARRRLDAAATHDRQAERVTRERTPRLAEGGSGSVADVARPLEPVDDAPPDVHREAGVPKVQRLCPAAVRHDPAGLHDEDDAGRVTPQAGFGQRIA
jgi:hypothetical protein